MQYAVILGSDICLITKHLASAERERDFFSARFSEPANIVAIDDDIDASARLHRRLAVRNARE